MNFVKLPQRIWLLVILGFLLGVVVAVGITLVSPDFHRWRISQYPGMSLSTTALSEIGWGLVSAATLGLILTVFEFIRDESFRTEDARGSRRIRIEERRVGDLLRLSDEATGELETRRIFLAKAFTRDRQLSDDAYTVVLEMRRICSLLEALVIRIALNTTELDFKNMSEAIEMLDDAVEAVREGAEDCERDFRSANHRLLNSIESLALGCSRSIAAIEAPSDTEPERRAPQPYSGR